MTRCLTGLVAVITVGFGGGCSSLQRVGFEPRHLTYANRMLGSPTEGKALIVMSAADAHWTYQGPPAGKYAPLLTTKFEVGEITRQAALRVFGNAFTQGAEDRETADGADGFIVCVTPKVNKFTYQWKVDEDEAFIFTELWLSPPVLLSLEMELQVEFRSPDGRLVDERTYRSGPVAGNHLPFASEKEHFSELARLFHATVIQLLKRAVYDYRVLPGA